MTWTRTNLAGAAFAALVAGITYLVSGSSSSGDRALTAGIAFVAALLLFLLVSYGRAVVRIVAALPVRGMIFGLKSWGDSTRGKRGGDPLWEWLTDQLLVIQHRYAFSVGCIAFVESNPKRCLMVKRPFQGFGDQEVILWPGGRLRGSLEDFETEVKRLVRRETGCNVKLLSVQRLDAAFSEKLETWDPETNAAEIENELLASPILVMQQNRRQSHDVPGHIDLLYLGSVTEAETISNRGMWLDLSSVQQYNLSQLWPDTRACLERASRCYTNMLAQEPSSPQTPHGGPGTPQP